MNKFRALLVDPGALNQERPVQIFGNDRAEINRWADAVLMRAASPDAAVLIYQQTEIQIGIILKPKEQG